jgi:hypothetical protein
MGVLAAKLLLAPTFVVCASLAARRWGALVGGVIGGLPVVAGPILAILAIQHGNEFGSRAAAATLLGLISLTAFVLTYSFLARRASWSVCMVAGWAAFLVMTSVLDLFEVRALPAFVAACVVFALALAIMPRPEAGATTLVKPPAWDLPLRAFSAMALVLALTATADALGPRLSGLLAPFPIITTILAAFTHAQGGAESAIAILRGMQRGFFAFALFCFVVSVCLPEMAIGAAFALATIAALAAQAIVLWIVTAEAKPGVLSDERV